MTITHLVEAVKESFTTDLDRLDATNSLLISEQISTYRQQYVQKNGKYIHDEDEALAMIMIIAEID